MHRHTPEVSNNSVVARRAPHTQTYQRQTLMANLTLISYFVSCCRLEFLFRCYTCIWSPQCSNACTQTEHDAERSCNFNSHKRWKYVSLCIRKSRRRLVRTWPITFHSSSRFHKNVFYNRLFRSSSRLNAQTQYVCLHPFLDQVAECCCRRRRLKPLCWMLFDSLGLVEQHFYLDLLFGGQRIMAELRRRV